MRDRSDQRGAILILFAFLLPVLLLTVGTAYMLFSRAAAYEQIKAGSRMVLLAAAESYFAEDCEEDAEIDVCHGIKQAAAIDRATEVFALNRTVLGSVNIAPADSMADGDVAFSTGRYYFEKPLSSDPCPDSYPCYQPRVAGEIANAFELQGTITDNKILNTFYGLFGYKIGDSDHSFKVRVTAVPMRMCAVIDLSQSISYDTHPVNFSDDTQTRLVAFPLETDPSLGTEQIIDSHRPLFNNMDPTRGTDVPDPNALPNTVHYQDDYVRVEPLLGDGFDYDSYDEKEHHTRPDQAPNEYSAFMVDMYRQNPNYEGPEPWLSIMKGVSKSLEVFKDRAVAGDRACLIFYNDRLSWKYVANLTSKYNYLQEVLDPEAISDTTNITAASSWNARDSGNAMPRWARLGLFPIPSSHTNAPTAFREALSQFARDDIDVPSVDFITHFSDGLTTCFDETGTTSCDSSDYYNYFRSINDVHNMALTGMFAAKISLHQFLVGDNVMPHTRLLDNGSGDCQTDEELRKKVPPVDYVLGQDFNYHEKTEADIDDTIRTDYLRPQDPDTPVPFYQVNSDWYNIVRMTGGLWAPLRKKAPTCPSNTSPSNPDPPYVAPGCSGVTESSAEDEQRMVYDPLCRTIQEQVDNYLKEILDAASGFTVLPVD